MDQSDWNKLFYDFSWKWHVLLSIVKTTENVPAAKVFQNGLLNGSNCLFNQMTISSFNTGDIPKEFSAINIWTFYELTNLFPVNQLGSIYFIS